MSSLRKESFDKALKMLLVTVSLTKMIRRVSQLLIRKRRCVDFAAFLPVGLSAHLILCKFVEPVAVEHETEAAIYEQVEHSLNSKQSKVCISQFLHRQNAQQTVQVDGKGQNSEQYLNKTHVAPILG